jgi:glyoxylate reductase
MRKPKVFVTREIPEAGLKLIQDSCDVEIWLEDLPPSKETLIEKVRGIDGLLCLLTDSVDDIVMEAAGSRLKVISNYAVGYDNIDLKCATKRGIPVGNTPGVLTETTADLAFALLLSAARKIVNGSNYVRENKWETWGPKLLLGMDIFESTLGIIGMGRIGQAVARRARGFNMKILYYDHKHRPELGKESSAEICNSIEEVLRCSDFISLHVPLNNETRFSINRESFRIMKNSAILINTARGEIVDQEALYDALSHKVIAYAALDVTTPEPLRGDNKLVLLENCLIVPHIGSASFRTRNKMAVMSAENLLAGLTNEKIPYVVNPEVYDVLQS